MNDVAVSTTGSGPPAVFIPGGFLDALMWMPMAAFVAPKNTMLSVDLPGHGQSEPVREAVTATASAAAIARALDARSIERAHVVSMSAGGSVAAHLALQRPDLVRTLTLHEPALVFSFGDRSERAQIAATLASVFDDFRGGDFEGGLRRFTPLVSNGSWDDTPEMVRSMMIRNAENAWSVPPAVPPEETDFFAYDTRLSTLEMPVLVTTGTESPPLFGPRCSELAAEMGATLAEVPGDHAAPALFPDAYATRWQSFTADTA